MTGVYCCETFAFHVSSACPEHPDRLDCGDTILHRYKFGYGIPVHDGGRSHIEIAYCPWCGTRLDGSVVRRRDHGYCGSWFEETEDPCRSCGAPRERHPRFNRPVGS